MRPASSSGRIALLALGLVLLTVVTRLPALLHPQPIDDEEVYAVVAHEMLAGGLPYRDAIERKPPLLFWTYQAVFEAGGAYNWFALHALALAWTLLTMGGLFVVSRRLFDAETGLVAALLYSVFQPWATWKNLAFNGELLINLPLVWAWAIGLGPSRSRFRPELLGAGPCSPPASCSSSPRRSPRCRSGSTCCCRPTGRRGGIDLRIPSSRPRCSPPGSSAPSASSRRCSARRASWPRPGTGPSPTTTCPTSSGPAAWSTRCCSSAVACR